MLLAFLAKSDKCVIITNFLQQSENRNLSVRPKIPANINVVFVTPAKAGVQDNRLDLGALDSRFRAGVSGEFAMDKDPKAQ